MIKTVILTVVSLLVLSGCGDKEESESAPSMKCGSGKCGANMFDGNSALIKKKKNILSQMRPDDPRRDCVIKAETTKATYNCVREPDGNRLTLKCGVGRCGNASKELKMEPKMKCGAGKCGTSQ